MRRGVMVLAAAFLGVVFAACHGSSPIAPPPATGNPPPPVVNTPPVVKSIAASDTRVEVGSPVTLTATVEDAETPVANLTYAWSVPNGTVSGTGTVVQWTPGADAVTPADFTVTLNVTEVYTSSGSQLK